VLAGKIAALRDGRLTPGFDDIRRAAVPALAHRILLNFEGEAEGVRADDVVRALLDVVPQEPPR